MEPVSAQAFEKSCKLSGCVPTYLLMPFAIDSRLWTRRVLFLLAGVFVLRVIYLFTVVDFQLSGDEAYYWDWGRRLDWGYFSKPPLIGWLMGAIGRLSGDSWQAIRLTSILFGTLSLWLLFLLGRSVYDARVGFFAVLLMLFSPANVALNFAMTIDAPLVLCWTAALVLFWRVCLHPDSVLSWAGLTLVIGIGTLAKQMMLVFPVLMILFVTLAPQHRAFLRKPAFWLSMFVALLFLAPVLWWNHSHGWPMIKHTGSHFVSEEHGFTDWLVETLTFPLLQAAFYSPVTWWLMVAALITTWRAWRSQDSRERFLWLFSAPPLLVFVLLSLRQHVNENWPAVYYLSAMVLLPGLALYRVEEKIPVRLKRALQVGAVFAGLLYLLIPVISFAGLRGHDKYDRFADLRGWEESGQKVAEFFAKVPRPEQTFVIITQGRKYASQLAFWMPQHPRVYLWNRKGVVESQYDVWPDGADKAGWDAFIVKPADDRDDGPMTQLRGVFRRSFENVETLGDVEVDIGNGTARRFRLFLGRNMLNWPPVDPDPAPNEVPESKEP